MRSFWPIEASNTGVGVAFAAAMRGRYQGAPVRVERGEAAQEGSEVAPEAGMRPREGVEGQSGGRFV